MNLEVDGPRNHLHFVNTPFREGFDRSKHYIYRRGTKAVHFAEVPRATDVIDAILQAQQTEKDSKYDPSVISIS